MKRSRTVLLTLLALFFPTIVSARGQELRFQRPNQAQQALRETQVNQNFRAPDAPLPAASAPLPAKRVESTMPAPIPRTAQRTIKIPATSPAPIRLAQQVPELAEPEQVELPQPTTDGEVEMPAPMQFEMGEAIEGYGLPCDGCGCEVGCGVADPSCGIYEPACGCAEPGCGMEVGCGSCVGLPGPDYICFPVCIPRFKDLSFWGGVHGFRGPRDFYAPGSNVPGSRSDSNFGFHEGVNISGRAPFIGLLFPQLSYQLGYQAVQSRFSGTVSDTNDRTQQFVTAGFFRQVSSGLQFGIVWDLMDDDLYVSDDLHQLRYEISLKSPQGREIGLWAATSTNSVNILGVEYEAVDQYAVFYRWDFGKSANGRFWGGFTGDSEGVIGAEFNTPINDRWSLQSGFNYLIPEQGPGVLGVSQESWNVGINLVWHLGRTARTCYRSPYRPMFSVADNGWMFVDRVD
jgi:hypothetical protein